MNTHSCLRNFLFALLLSLPLVLIAQAPAHPKPYRVLTSGKQVTIKTTKDMKMLMIWSASGHRIVEQKEINSSRYEFRTTVNDKYLFMMVQLADGKVYTEKIGLP